MNRDRLLVVVASRLISRLSPSVRLKKVSLIMSSLERRHGDEQSRSVTAASLWDGRTDGCSSFLVNELDV